MFVCARPRPRVRVLFVCVVAGRLVGWLANGPVWCVCLVFPVLPRCGPACCVALCVVLVLCCCGLVGLLLFCLVRLGWGRLGLVAFG